MCPSHLGLKETNRFKNWMIHYIFVGIIIEIPQCAHVKNNNNTHKNNDILIGPVMAVSLLPDPKKMNDTAPDHTANHNACGSQSDFRKLAPLFDEHLYYPIRVLQQASSPAFTPLVAN